MKFPLRKIALVILIVSAFVTVGGMTFLDEYFYRTRPREPDQKTERIYPQNVKSSRGVARVYLTRTERMPFEWIQYWNPILAAAVIVTAGILVMQKRKRSLGSST